jgi:hypothetical protein
MSQAMLPTQFIRLAMVTIKTINFCKPCHVGLAQSWKERLLFIGGVSLSASSEVLQCSLDRVEFLDAKTPALPSQRARKGEENRLPIPPATSSPELLPRDLSVSASDWGCKVRP